MKFIPLTQGKFATVDDSDFSRISKHKWTAMNDRGVWRAYRKTNRGRTNIYMHREVLGLLPSKSPLVDHIDRDGLNNQKSNLRLCSASQNNSNAILSSKNTSGLKGVRIHRGRWEAHISVSNKTHYVGSYDTAKEAAVAYDSEAVRLRGEFALTNKKLGLL